MSRAVAESAVLASTIALAHMMPPSAFGHAAVASIVVALATILGPSGLTAPLVQRRSIRPDHIAASVVLGLSSGVALAGLTLVFARTGAETLFGEDIAGLMELAAPAWLITGLGAVPQALLQRDLRFKRMGFIDSTSVLLGAAVAVGLALAGRDASAILIGALATLAAASLLSLRAAPFGSLRVSEQAFRDVGPFAATQATSGLAYLAFRNVDYAILGARMTAANVGLYWRAYQLGVLYQGRISQILSRVSFPVYSRIEARKDLLSLRLKITRIHATVLVPLLCGFIATAPVAIPFVFGEEWQPAVLPTQIMAIAGICDAIMTGTGPLMIAIGRPGILLNGTLMSLAAYGLLIYLLSSSGLIAVSIGVATFSVVEAATWQHFMLRRYAGVPNRQFLVEALPGFAVGAVLLVALTALRVGLDAMGMDPLPSLVALLVAGVVAYTLALRVLFPGLFRELVDILRRLGSRTNSTPSAGTGPSAGPPPSGTV